MIPPKVVVGSGWWCDSAAHDWIIGDEVTKTPAFFKLWRQLVVKYLQPDAIVITDSHSPIKPDASARESVTWIDLDRNYGHANDLRLGRIATKYAGDTRSRIMGCTYALCCDADYFVHLEQDCVIRGERFIETALSGTTQSIVVGDRTAGGRGLIPGTIALPLYQNSLMIVRRSGMERFISRLLVAPESDGQLAPELKMERDFRPFDLLAIPYGRSRPIEFNRSHFYAQHLTAAELMEFCDVEGVDLEALQADHGSRAGT